MMINLYIYIYTQFSSVYINLNSCQKCTRVLDVLPWHTSGIISPFNYSFVMEYNDLLVLLWTSLMTNDVAHIFPCMLNNFMDIFYSNILLQFWFSFLFSYYYHLMNRGYLNCFSFMVTTSCVLFKKSLLSQGYEFIALGFLLASYCFIINI